MALLAWVEPAIAILSKAHGNGLEERLNGAALGHGRGARRGAGKPHLQSWRTTSVCCAWACVLRRAILPERCPTSEQVAEFAARPHHKSLGTQLALAQCS